MPLRAPFPPTPSPRQPEGAGRKEAFCKEAVALQASPGPCQSPRRSRQAARHTYSFSPASLSCLLVLCRALIHSS